MRGLALYREQRLQNMQELYDGLYNGAMYGYDDYRNINQNNVNTTKSRKTLYVVLAVSIIAILGFLAFFSSLFFFSSKENGQDKNSDNTQKDAVETAEITEEPTQIPTEIPTQIPTEEPIEPAVERVPLYNPNLTYKRMPEIHNSEASDDTAFMLMNEFIGNYVILCDDFMNYGSEEILDYLAPGSTAYNQQTGYKKKHPSLTQSIVSWSVQDVRQYGSYYYVWDTEELRETENGITKNTISHWVYKISRTGDLYKVIDYTYDPIYK